MRINWDALPRPQVHGHRGARALLPENTLPAFKYAIAAGVDAIELDLAVTKDNVIVVSHDPVLNAPICRGPKSGAAIRELTLAQVREWDCGAERNPAFPRQQTVPGARIPTLDEVFALAPDGAFLFNIEAKSFPDHPQLAPPPDEFARLILERVRAHSLELRVIFQSFDFRVLRAMERIAPDIEISALYVGPAKDFRTIAQESGAGIVAPQFKLITSERVDQAHSAGLRVMTWTPNAPADWDALIGWGVDAIITDDPAALLKYLGRTS